LQSAEYRAHKPQIACAYREERKPMEPYGIRLSCSTGTDRNTKGDMVSGSYARKEGASTRIVERSVNRCGAEAGADRGLRLTEGGVEKPL
jgi:hypothetical protein